MPNNNTRLENDSMTENKDKKTTAKRTRKTPEQRAVEAYGVADRAVKKLEAKVKSLTKDLEQAKTSLREAEEDRSYLAGSPKLPEGFLADGGVVTGDDMGAGNPTVEGTVQAAPE